MHTPEASKSAATTEAAASFFGSNYEIAYQMGLLDTITILYGKIVTIENLSPLSFVSENADATENDNSRHRLVMMLEDSIPAALHSANHMKHLSGNNTISSSTSFSHALEFTEPSTLCVRSATLSQRAIEEVTKTAGSLTDFVVCRSINSNGSATDDPICYTWFPSVAMSLCNCSPASMRTGSIPKSTRQFISFDTALRDATQFMCTKAQRVCRYAKGNVSKRRKLLSAARTVVTRVVVKTLQKTPPQLLNSRTFHSTAAVINDEDAFFPFKTSFWQNSAVYKIVGAILAVDAGGDAPALAEKVTQFYISVVKNTLLELTPTGGMSHSALEAAQSSFTRDTQQDYYLAHIDVTEPLAGGRLAVYAVLESDFL